MASRMGFGTFCAPESIRRRKHPLLTPNNRQRSRSVFRPDIILNEMCGTNIVLLGDKDLESKPESSELLAWYGVVACRLTHVALWGRILEVKFSVARVLGIKNRE